MSIKGEWIENVVTHAMKYYSTIKKEQTHNSVGESQNCHAVWKKPDAEECVLYDVIYIKLYNRQN